MKTKILILVLIILTIIGIKYLFYRSNTSEQNDELLNSLDILDETPYQTPESELAKNDLEHQDNDSVIVNGKIYTNNKYNFQLTFWDGFNNHQVFKDAHEPEFSSWYFIFSQEKHPIGDLISGYIYLMTFPKGGYQEAVKETPGQDYGPGTYLGSSNDYDFSYIINTGENLSEAQGKEIMKTFKLTK